MACRKTAVSARRVALQMIHNTIVCAPDGLRDQLRSLTRMQLVRTLASWRPDLTAYRDFDSAYRIWLKSLARRYLELHDEIADLDVMIAAIVDELAANLIARNSFGHIGAAQLLLTAGDNPERLRSEASFASLCGVSPVPASSGKTVRHRLNRGGDRAANSALHIIAIGRLRTDQRTKDYVARRIAEGHSKLDAIRALKRYLAREVFTLITQRRKEINATRIARQPIRQRRLPETTRNLQHEELDEPKGRLLGQRRDRNALRFVEGRAVARNALCDTPSGKGRGDRLASVLQSPEASLDAGISRPDGLREKTACR